MSLLTDFTHAQPVADRLKGLMRQCAPDMRRYAESVLQQFEGAPWSPLALEAVMAHTPGSFNMDSDPNWAYTPDPDQPANVCLIIAVMLTSYLVTIGVTEDAAQLYSTNEAAAYLGLSRRGLTYWLYEVPEAQRLVPDKLVGHALIFTKATLDRFNTTIRQGNGHPS
jgi:hypothetical protein